MRFHRIQDAILLLTVAGYTAGLATAGLVALFALLVGEVLLRSWRWIPTPLDLPLLGLVLAVLGSSVASEWRAFTVDLVVYFLFAVFVSVCSVAAYASGGVDRVVRLLVVWVAGGAGAAVWALARSWPVGLTPASTAILNGNTLGTTMAVTAVIALALLMSGAFRRPWVGGLGLAAVIVGLIATLARAAWVGAAAGVVTLMLVGPHLRARAALAVACAILVGVGWAALPRSPVLDYEIRSTVSLHTNRNRLALWRSALKIFADYPVLGTGYGTFPYVYPLYRLPDALDANAPYAHNIFLNFAAETGALGLAAFVSLCAAGLVSAWRWLARSPPSSAARAVSTAVLAALVTMLVNQFFEGNVMGVHTGFGLLALFVIGAVGERSLRKHKERHAA